MAQTTGAQTFRAADVEFSADDTTWVDAGGHGAGVAVSGGDRAIGEQHTFDGDVPIVKSGKRAAISVTIRYVYTETVAEPFEAARAIYETPGAECYVRWFPVGKTAGNYAYSTGAGVMTAFKYPEGEPDPGTIILGEFTVTCASITKDTWVS